MPGGYEFQFCRIDQLQELIDNHDLSILENPKFKIVLKAFKGPYKALGQQAVNDAQALLNGSFNVEDHSCYGMALQYLFYAATGNKPFQVEGLEEMRVGALKDIPYCQWLDVLIPPCGLPRYPLLSPYVGHITLASIKRIIEEWQDDLVSNCEDGFSDILKNLRKVYRSAIRRKVDILVYYA